MNNSELPDFLFHLYDYADYIADQIRPNNPNNGQYFLTLVFIEKMFDQYGRGLIASMAQEADGGDGDASSRALSEAHRRIDLLRERIRKLSEEYDFNETLDRAGKQVASEWRRS